MEEFSYIYIDNFLYSSFYINLDQSLFCLIFFLFFRGKPFGFLERKTKKNIINFFLPVVRLIRVLQLTYLYNRKRKLNKRTPGFFPTISSLHKGHCLILGGQGEYKIINFRRNCVTTVFPNDFSNSVMENRAYKLKEAQNCKLSPTLLDWNITGRYMKESYLNLKPICFELNDIKSVYLETLPILKDILLSKDRKIISLRQYIQDVSIRIDQLLNPFLKNNVKLVNNIKIILEFISEINDELHKEASETEIILGFSHGDFWEGNILKSGKTQKVIDWNTLEIRSAFFDFYFITFDKVSSVSEASLYETSREIEKAFHTFISNHLDGNFINSKLATKLEKQLELYRFIFYLEFIIQRVTENASGEPRYFKYLGDRIKFFQMYESIVGERKSNKYMIEKI
ncbi:hypothetical protein [Bacillus sp. AFS017336]|uniref:hypothetical protein n=1 Tax=Bacillus sp. AFS017336 TaxID=2033489 RepID=UPI000BEFD20E|nr:hypothetical protein [Bacillus sp. AFS017336]PEL07020.1 hypothetical protein CN601_20225 [Bacillus sp. AFS017336]